jgi:hypothetical protein
LSLSVVKKVLVFLGPDKNSPDIMSGQVGLGAVLYKDRFDGFVKNTRDIMFRIVVNRRDVYGKDHQTYDHGNVLVS